MTLSVLQVTCHQCGNEYDAGDGTTLVIHGVDVNVCGDCRNEFNDCDHCNDTTHNYDLYSANDGNVELCESCFDETRSCENCGDHYTDHLTHYVEGHGHVCHHCIDDYPTCPSCTDQYHEDDTVYDESSGDLYCRSCFDDLERNRSVIQSYGYRPSAVYFGNVNYHGVTAHYGVELEVDKGYSKEDAARLVTDLAPETYCKEDGSLDEGFEIVTHPCTYDHHMSDLDWSGIVEACLAHDMRSHNTNTCGLHIHVSRSGFGADYVTASLNIAKVMLLFDRWWNDHIVPFSRRDYSRLEQWAKKPDLYLNEHTASQDIPEILSDYRNDKGRYQAINLENRATVEFRLFRGTLKVNTIKASIQFLEHLIGISNATDLKDIPLLEWSSVFNLGRLEDYPELQNYLIERGLI